MLGENSLNSQEPSKDDQVFKKYFGFALLIMGVAGAAWVFHTVYSIFNDPMKLTLFQQLVEGKLNIVLDSGQGNVKVLIPKEFLTYQVPILLLIIALGVVGILVKAGAGLLDGSYQKMRRKIDALGNRLEKKIDQK